MEEIKIPKFDYEYEMVDDLGNLYAPKDDGIDGEELEFVEAKIAELEGDVQETELALAPITLKTKSTIFWQAIMQSDKHKPKYLTDVSVAEIYKSNCNELKRYIDYELEIANFVLNLTGTYFDMVLGFTNPDFKELYALVFRKHIDLRPLEWKAMSKYKIEFPNKSTWEVYTLEDLQKMYKKYQELLIDVKNSEWAKPDGYEED